MAMLVAAQPVVALADDPQPGAAIIRKVGTPTPFPGILLSDEAYANMKAQHERELESAENRRQQDLKLLDAHLALRTATTANELKAVKAADETIFGIKDKQIASLEDKLEKADEKARSASNVGTLERVGWFALGVATILGGALAIHWASTK